MATANINKTVDIEQIALWSEDEWCSLFEKEDADIFISKKVIPNLLLKDRFHLEKKFRKMIKQCQTDNLQHRDREPLQKLIQQVRLSLNIIKQRCEQIKQTDFSKQQALPIIACKQGIADALEKHQVVIVAGETGSGKTTQLPKICLEMDRGIYGRIGHTQPRRLAARTVATRIAEELEVEMGEAVGYQFRFNDRVSDSTRVKVMTDGILLAEIAHDRFLTQYDTLIIDEAHERSLTIDFLLGYLKGLIKRRAELKLIVTSATIDVKRFADYFDNAPVVEVPGRSYPVDIIYLPDELSGTLSDVSISGAEKEENENKDDSLGSQLQTALDMIESVASDKAGSSEACDVLVFLPGEREIRESSRYLRNNKVAYQILPLYARLTQVEQQKIFSISDKSRAGFKRRVILATNVAETSVTVPGIGFVIDTGKARISRYSARSKLQRLPVESISKASANQRAGRCGRIAPGTCIRLYEETDFEARPDFTEPEILRTNLAAVILQMKHLGLGEIDHFPFIDSPTVQQIKAGVKALFHLGAINESEQLTSTGKKLVRLPVDPSLARMLIAAVENQCLAEVLVVVSALAVQDPREFPADKRSQSEEKHSRFKDKRSDFLSFIYLWSYLEQLRSELSQNQFRKRCQQEFLSYTRVREWRDLHHQLVLAIRDLKLATSVSMRSDQFEKLIEIGESGLQKTLMDSVFSEKIHRSILVGVPLNIGMREEITNHSNENNKKDKVFQKNKGQYLGVRGLKFFPFPASSMFKVLPKWILAAEIVETRKVYARIAASIQKEWIVNDLSHLLVHEYAEPFWHKKRGQVLAKRSSLFFGLKVESGKLVDYEKIDSEKSRTLFIADALVEQELNPEPHLLKQAEFWQHNEKVIEKVKALEDKCRRRDLMVDAAALYAFYDQYLPSGIASRTSLLRHLKQEKSSDFNQTLKLTENDVLLKPVTTNAEAQFPDSLLIDNKRIKLQYSFSPGEEQDGVTAEINLHDISELPIYAFDYLVPGLLLEKCIALFRLLPKSDRKQLLPLQNTVQKILSAVDVPTCMQNNIPLCDVLAEQIQFNFMLKVDSRSWRQRSEQELESFYRIRFVVRDSKQQVVGERRDIAALQQELIKNVEQGLTSQKETLESKKVYRTWAFKSLGESVSYKANGIEMQGYRTLNEVEDGVIEALAASQEDAIYQSYKAVTTLATISLNDKMRFIKKQYLKDERKLLPLLKLGNRESLLVDFSRAVIAKACFDHFKQDDVTTNREFEVCIASGRSHVVSVANELEKILNSILDIYQPLINVLTDKKQHFPLQYEDIQSQLNGLIYTGFLENTGYDSLLNIPRYLQAIQIRLERLGGNFKIDNELCEKLASLQQPLKNLLYKYPNAMFFDEHVANYRWLLEELRVSLFAQQLKTSVPVSIKRVEKAWSLINLNRYPLISHH